MPPRSDGGRPHLAARAAAAFGARAIAAAEHAGGLGDLTWRVANAIVRLRVSPKAVSRQLYVMGVQSTGIVVVTGALAGVVTSQQGSYQMTSVVPDYVLGSLVVETVILEMGPVLTALVLVGRIGARITAELGTMVVSEQIDAFEALGRDPLEILGTPRVVAGVIVMPLLVGLSNITGCATGFLAANLDSGLGLERFLYGARLFWNSWDIVYSVTKALAFGLFIPLIAVHMGFRTTGGAEGVGKITTRAVMFMTVTILVLDAMFPPLLLN